MRFVRLLLALAPLACGSAGMNVSPPLDDSDATTPADAAPIAPANDGAVDAPGLPDAAPSLQDGGPDATYGPGLCAQCVASACSDELTACNGDPDCANYLACVDSCPVGPTGFVLQSCETTCPTSTTSSGMAVEQQLVACMASAAGSQCTSCGADAGAPVPPPPSCSVRKTGDGCADCLIDNCCNDFIDCQGNSDCLNYEACVLACVPTTLTGDAGLTDDGGGIESDDGGALESGTAESGTAGDLTDAGDAGAPALNAAAACEEACNQIYPSGRALWAPLNVCIQVSCGGPTACDNMAGPCLQCTVSQCATQYVNYSGSSSGFALTFCIAGCGLPDVDCQNACYLQFPDALGTATALNECALEDCPACQGP